MSSVGLTPAGNQYVQTSAGKKTGAAAGAVVGGVAGYKLMNKVVIKSGEAILNSKYSDKLTKFAEKYPIKLEKLIKATKLGTIIAGAALLLPVGLGIGAMIDKAINHNRQVKADNNAE